MGAGNVLLVTNLWSPYLNNASFRALVQMAVISLDKDLPPVYHGGWAPVARALGVPFPAGCGQRVDGRINHEGKPMQEPGRCSGCDTAQRNFRDVVSTLRKKGAIEQVQDPMRGRNARYALLLNKPPPASELIPRKSGPKKKTGTTVVPCAGDDRGPLHEGPPSSQTGDHRGPYKEDGGGVEEQIEESRSPLPGTSPARDPGPGDEIDLIPAPRPATEPDEKPALRPTPGPDANDLTQCPRCRWAAWEGHAAGCPAR